MEWWEKEYAYEVKWQNGTVAKDLWKYVPRRLEEAVDDVLVEITGGLNERIRETSTPEI